MENEMILMLKKDIKEEIKRKRELEMERLDAMEEIIDNEISIAALLKNFKYIYPDNKQKYKEMEKMLRRYFKGDFFKKAVYYEKNNSLSIEDEFIKISFLSYIGVDQINLTLKRDLNHKESLEIKSLEFEKSFVKAASRINDKNVRRKLAMKYQLYTEEYSDTVSLKPKRFLFLVREDDIKKLSAQLKRIIEEKEEHNEKVIRRFEDELKVNYEDELKKREILLSELKEFEEEGWVINNI